MNDTVFQLPIQYVIQKT